ncbi:hypothetical protein DFH09DRAFT_1113079 [Mycena vulgaris]|nr:hypothetical protein DFH09DRAFT_1113079 [Mycena vulgaris]
MRCITCSCTSQLLTIECAQRVKNPTQQSEVVYTVGQQYHWTVIRGSTSPSRRQAGVKFDKVSEDRGADANYTVAVRGVKIRISAYEIQHERLNPRRVPRHFLLHEAKLKGYIWLLCLKTTHLDYYRTCAGHLWNHDRISASTLWIGGASSRKFDFRSRTLESEDSLPTSDEENWLNTQEKLAPKDAKDFGALVKELSRALSCPYPYRQETREEVGKCRGTYSYAEGMNLARIVPFWRTTKQSPTLAQVYDDYGGSQNPMLCKTPLDVVLLIVRLLTVKDALSLFVTCRRLDLSDCRSFWVYANIDLDTIPCAPGRKRIDYSQWTTPALRARVIKAWRVYKAWMASDHQPKRIHVLPLAYDMSRILHVPWSHLVVVIGHRQIFLHDWTTGAATEVCLPDGRETVYLPRLFWAEAIQQNILFVHSVSRHTHNQPVRSRLHLFSINIEDRSTSYLVAMDVPFSVCNLDFRGSRLAFCSSSMLRTNTVQIYDVRFGSEVSLHQGPTFRAVTRDSGRNSTFALMDANRFLFAGPGGVSIFELPAEALASTVSSTRSWPATSIWSPKMPREALSCPPLGPVTYSGGIASISVASGNFLQCVKFNPTDPTRNSVTRRPIVDKLPVYLGITAGFRVGAYRRPYALPSFTTFSIAPDKEELHPLLYATDYSIKSRGSVVYRYSILDSLEPGSLQIDEGQGLLMFILRTHGFGREAARVIVLELV